MRLEAKRSALKFACAIERSYQAATEQWSRDTYSIFYSLPQLAELMVLNKNPSGTPEDHWDADLMKNQHTLIDHPTRNLTLENTRALLEGIGGKVREIQVANIAFRRHPRWEDLPHFKTSAWIKEAKPFLKRIIRRVRPRHLIVGGRKGVESLATGHEGYLEHFGSDLDVCARKQRVSGVREYHLELPYLDYRIHAIGVLHPAAWSKSARREITERVRSSLIAKGWGRNPG